MGLITCTPNALLSREPCGECLPEREILAILAIMLCKITNQDANATCTVADLADAAKCFTCMSDSDMLRAIAVLVYNYGIDNGYLASATGLRQDSACMLCADPKLVRAIILYYICLGFSTGTILCINRQ